MKYRINPAELTSVFTLPCRVADEQLKLTGAVQLKVLLWVYRHISEAPDSAAIAKAIGVPEADINDALRYWCDAGILLCADEPAVTVPAPKNEVPKKTVSPQTRKPDRVEVSKRGLECPEIAFLLQEAQQLFGRCLRQSEASTLVWLYDDEGMGVAVLLMLIQYAVSEERCNIGFIERTALDWIDSGVTDLKTAEAKLNELARRKTAWGIVCRAFSMDRRAPSKKEQETAYKWIEEWKYGQDILKAAYDACADSISKFSFPYIDKIITGWHKQGVKTLDDIENIEKPEKKNSYGTYDLSLAEKMLDSD